MEFIMIFDVDFGVAQRRVWSTNNNNMVNGIDSFPFYSAIVCGNISGEEAN